MLDWLWTEKNYEGFPLFLRRPTNLDIDSLRPCFPQLVAITHTFAKRMPNGLPEVDYNHGLAELDHSLIISFDIDHMGVPVLIETFGGKRNYYFYVSADADIEAVVSQAAQRFPGERLSSTTELDPNWSFITKYAKEHF